jgi:hypothetical protein
MLLRCSTARGHPFSEVAADGPGGVQVVGAGGSGHLQVLQDLAMKVLAVDAPAARRDVASGRTRTVCGGTSPAPRWREAEAPVLLDGRLIERRIRSRWIEAARETVVRRAVGRGVAAGDDGTILADGGRRKNEKREYRYGPMA